MQAFQAFLYQNIFKRVITLDNKPVAIPILSAGIHL
jgi:hypothetical protein